MEYTVHVSPDAKIGHLNPGTGVGGKVMNNLTNSALWLYVEQTPVVSFHFASLPTTPSTLQTISYNIHSFSVIPKTFSYLVMTF